MSNHYNRVNIMIVGGTWDENDGKSSSLINKIANAVTSNLNRTAHPPVSHKFACYNGGNYHKLEKILSFTPEYDIVFWFANVNNNLPKIRDVKSIAPKTMLVTSKRNDNEKYSFQELVQRALAAKANLCFEFSKQEEKLFQIRIFDPLACLWYQGTDIQTAVDAAMDRLYYLKSITRQNTTQTDDSKELALAWYFNSFKSDMFENEQAFPNISQPDVNSEPEQFVQLVKNYAGQFHELMKLPSCVTRFVGNCSMGNTPPQVGRCSKGMPSFKYKGYIFVSKRNIDKSRIELEDFVPVYEESNKIYYLGENKPSVDAPIQIKLYAALPNIRYILHSHCYITDKDVAMTDKAIPCGAIEEVAEILSVIDKKYTSRDCNFYAINLKGHGSLLMAKTPELMRNIEYVARPMPESITNG